MTKKCKKCGEDKLLTCFYKSSTTKDRLNFYCSDCCKADNKRNKDIRSEKYQLAMLVPGARDLRNSKQRELLSKNLESYLLGVSKARAKKWNLEHNLEQTDIIIPDLCPILNVKLKRGTKYAPSIDRIDNNKGYIKGNILVISRLANMMKSSADLATLSIFCENAMKVYSKLLN